MYHGTLNLDPSEDDRLRGVKAYSAIVKECPITGKPTNLIFMSPSGKLVFAYDQEAANKQE